MRRTNNIQEEIFGKFVDLLNKIPQNEKALIHVGSIFHSFNKSLANSLNAELDTFDDFNGYSIPEDDLERKILKLPLDKRFGNGNFPFAIDRSVRMFSNDYLAHNHNEVFIALHKHAGKLFSKINTQNGANEDACDSLAEEVYHLLISENDKGFNKFAFLFDKSIHNFDYDRCNQLLRFAEEANPYHSSNEYIGEILYRKARLLYFERRREEAIQLLHEIIDASYSESIVARAKATLGIIYIYQDYPDKGAELQFAAWKYFHENKDDYRSAWALYYLGQALIEAGHYVEAIAYVNEGIQIGENLDGFHGVGFGYEQLGRAYLMMRKYDSAEKFLYLSLRKHNLNKNAFGKGWTLLRLGQLFEFQRFGKKALEYYSDAAETFEIIDDFFAETKAQTFLLLAQIRTQQFSALSTYMRISHLVGLMGSEIGEGRKFNNLVQYFNSFRVKKFVATFKSLVFDKINVYRRLRINPQILSVRDNLEINIDFDELEIQHNKFTDEQKRLKLANYFSLGIFIVLIISILFFLFLQNYNNELLDFIFVSIMLGSISLILTLDRIKHVILGRKHIKKKSN